MSNTFYRRTQWVPGNNPDTANETDLYAPGELGGLWPTDDRIYQKVQVDSGATSLTPAGAVAAAQVAFWKDKASYLTTNDSRFANGGVGDARNFVAGIYRGSLTAGNYGFILVQGKAIPVKCTTSPTAGALLVANTGTDADATSVAAGTAPTCIVIGTAQAPKSGANVPTDVNLTPII